MKKLRFFVCLLFVCCVFQCVGFGRTQSDGNIQEDSSDTIFNIGFRRELFIDDFLIKTRENIELLMHSPVKKEIVMVYDKPWEGSGSDFQVVFRDNDILRMYYMGAQLTNNEGTKFGGHPVYACYAESKDGIHWTKPDLELFEFEGSKKNNIVWAKPRLDNFTPFLDANPNCKPDEKYKAVSPDNGGLCALKSADGIHWSYLSEKPIITKGQFDTQNNAFWDPVRNCYWCYFRDFHDNPGNATTDLENGIRDIRVSKSKDFLNWTDPQMIKFVDSPDVALYTNQVIPYYRAPHLFLGFPTQYVVRNFSSAAMRSLPDPEHRQLRMKFHPRLGTALTNGLFMSSYDGVTFNRKEDVFIPIGIQCKNNWVYGDGYQCLGLIETLAEDTTAPNELSFYAGEDQWKASANLRRYTIRIDGFVSLHAGQKPGDLVTKRLIFSGNKLTINFSTSAAGSIFVELQDENGKAIPGYSLSDCDELFGDELERTVTWKDKSQVTGLIGKPVYVHVIIREADLYSLKFQE
jgi:hypothetical protein